MRWFVCLAALGAVLAMLPTGRGAEAVSGLHLSTIRSLLQPQRPPKPPPSPPKPPTVRGLARQLTAQLRTTRAPRGALASCAPRCTMLRSCVQLHPISSICACLGISVSQRPFTQVTLADVQVFINGAPAVSVQTNAPPPPNGSGNNSAPQRPPVPPMVSLFIAY